MSYILDLFNSLIVQFVGVQPTEFPDVEDSIDEISGELNEMSIEMDFFFEDMAQRLERLRSMIKTADIRKTGLRG